MKKICAVMAIGIFLLITIFKTQAQTNAAWQVKAIETYHVAIAFTKTTNIIFPYAIVSVDIGSRDILAQKAKGAENILQLKAAKDSFPQTNISIITADGKLTSFLVDYAQQPSVLNLALTGAGRQNTLSIPSESMNREQMEHLATVAVESKAKVRGVKDKTFGVCLKLNGVFIRDDMMLLRFHIANGTNINYDIDQLRLYIRDQKKAKRTATQEIEILPVLVQDNTNRVSGQSDNTIVFVVPKFTIPDKKYLAVQLMEKNGGRHLELYVKNRKMVKAIPVE